MSSAAGLVRRASLLERHRLAAAVRAAGASRGQGPNAIAKMLEEMVAAAPRLTDAAIDSAAESARAEFEDRRRRPPADDALTAWLVRLCGMPAAQSFTTADDYSDAIGSWHRAHRAAEDAARCRP